MMRSRGVKHLRRQDFRCLGIELLVGEEDAEHRFLAFGVVDEVLHGHVFLVDFLIPDFPSCPGGEAFARLPCFLHLEAHALPSLVELGPVLVEVVEHFTVVLVGIG